MATTNADFKVKKGLQVEGGDIHLGVDQDGSLSTDNRSGTDLIGRHLSIIAGTGTGNAVGGRIDFYTGGAAGSSGTSATTSTQVLRMNSDGQSVFYGNLSLSDNNLTNVGDINADSISVDASSTGLNVDFSGANTGTGVITLGDNLASALDIKEGSNSYLKFTTTDSSEQIVFSKNSTFASTTIANLGTVTTADIDGGTIDGTVIGGSDADAGTFTSLTVDKTGGEAWIRVNGTARETNTRLQVNGDKFDTTTTPAASSANTSFNYVEARLHTDVANDDINGTTYAKIGNMFLLDNAEDVPGTGQGVMFTVGRSGTGDHFGVGRVIQGASATEYFGIGYAGTNFDDTPGTNAALLPANLMFELDVSGNASLSKDGATLEFNDNSQTTKIRGSGSATESVTYTLPPAAPAGNNYVLQSSTAGVMSWATAAGGADGMGSGFVLEDNAGLSYEDQDGKTQSVQQITILSLDTDEGALEPLAVGEIICEVRY